MIFVKTIIEHSSIIKVNGKRIETTARCHVSTKNEYLYIAVLPKYLDEKNYFLNELSTKKKIII